MFELTADNVYHWRLIFGFLSLEFSAPFLKKLGFPLAEQNEALINISRSFLRRLHLYGPHFSFRGNPTERVRLLFDNTYERLAQELGEMEAQQLIQWGNLLDVAPDLEVTVEWTVDALSKFNQHYSPADEPPLPLPVDRLTKCLKFYWNEKWVAYTLGVTNDIYDVKAHILDDPWGRDITYLVNAHVHLNDELQVEMEGFLYDWVGATFSFLSNVCALKTALRQFTPDELSAIEAWLKTHPKWLENQTTREQGSGRFYSLTKLLKELEAYEGPSWEAMCAQFE